APQHDRFPFLRNEVAHPFDEAAVAQLELAIYTATTVERECPACLDEFLASRAPCPHQLQLTARLLPAGHEVSGRQGADIVGQAGQLGLNAELAPGDAEPRRRDVRQGCECCNRGRAVARIVLFLDIE